MQSTQKQTVIAALSLVPEHVTAVTLEADAIAQCTGASLKLIHVVDEIALISPVTEFGVADYIPDEIEERQNLAVESARETLLRILPEVREGPDLEIKVGIPAQTLEQAAGELNASMIVVGQPHAFFGSVTKHLVSHAPCNVHVVRLPEENS